MGCASAGRPGPCRRASTASAGGGRRKNHRHGGGAGVRDGALHVPLPGGKPRKYQVAVNNRDFFTEMCTFLQPVIRSRLSQQRRKVNPLSAAFDGISVAFDGYFYENLHFCFSRTGVAKRYTFLSQEACLSQKSAAAGPARSGHKNDQADPFRVF